MAGQAAGAGAPPLGLKTKLLYGFGSIAYGVKDLGFRAFLLLYYNQVIGLRADYVSIAIAVALVIDSFLDPIIGQVSDTWRSKWGRRHPFMYASAIPAAVSFYFLWLPPEGLSEMGLIVYLGVMAVIVRSFIAVYEIPSSALVSELTSDYDQRTSILSYRYFFGYWGGLALYATALWFFFPSTSEYPRGQLNPAGYADFAILGAGMMLASILISAWGTQDRIPYLHVPHVPKRSLGTTMGEMFATFSHHSFLMIMLAGVVGGIAIGVASALNLYWATYLWDLTPRQITILLLDNFFAAAIAIYVAPYLSKRFGKKQAKIWLLISAVLIGVLPLVLRQYGLFFENGSPWLVPALLLWGTVYGVLGTCSLIMTSSMIADVVEDSQRKTGRRSEGLLFAASSLVQKAVSGLGVLATGIILTAAAFPEKAKPGAVSTETMNHLISIYVFTILGLYLVAVFFISQYRISRETHEENLRRLAEEVPSPEQELAPPAAIAEPMERPEAPRPRPA